MSQYREKAQELFTTGCNCAQAVFCAFCDKTGLTMEQAAAAASMFGGGIARTRNTCGAVSGMLMAAGIILGGEDYAKKAELYETGRKLMDTFREINGSCVCGVLLGEQAGQPGGEPEPRTKQYYEKRPCSCYVGDAAEILENYLSEIGK